MIPNLLSTKKRLIFFIVISITVMGLLTGLKLFFSYKTTSKSAENALAKQYTEIAMEAANGLDKAVYKKFLLTKSEDEHHLTTKLYLEEYRKRINALYVYTLLLDESEVSKVMVSAGPSAAKDVPIGFPCTVPAAEVRLAKSGVNYYTGIIHDELTGSYISIGAPFFDEKGEMLGIVGIDIAAEELGHISKHVIKSNSHIFGLDVLFALLLLAGVYLLNRWYKARWKQDLKESEKMYISELGKIVGTIKSSRHDLMNHLQVLNGLMDIRMYDKAHDYLKQLTTESRTMDLSLRVKNPFLMVLFQSKWELAHSKNIDITFETDFIDFDKMESMDLVKLFSNLLDNAIEAVEASFGELPQEIRVICKAEKGKYKFAIENAALLTDKELSGLFQYGFTTKGEGQTLRGNGLSIVKRTVEKYKGNIDFRYEEEKLLIQITI
ncbi:GHKL domain-containing protein [Paenibacillus sp. PL91]|uniref:GHKL domain-containing protein n=1 Tax=Paenibacillus sp. PL91 TaxID=2729538 RepID=UPI00145F9805|nr:GHKL domain-containing protein [Paenibacillus sp. PL91]MBC9201003.1 GHKL domain-containing protein [Paenibacillus sp. PL91]